MTRRRLAAAVALGVALYAGALVLVVTGEPREPQTLNLFALVLVAGLVFTVTGAIAAWRRPNNRTGAQMMAVGLLWSLGALQATNTSLPFTVGFVLEWARVRRLRPPHPLLSDGIAATRGPPARLGGARAGHARTAGDHAGRSQPDPDVRELP